MADHTNARRPLFDSVSDYLLAAALALVAAVLVGVWAVGQIAGLLFTFSWPDASVGDSLHILTHLGGNWADPRQAWPAAVHGQLPGPVGMYAAALIVLACATACAMFGLRKVGDRRRNRGFASPAEVRQAFTEKQVLARGARLRPDLDAPTAGQVAVPLGRTRIPLWLGIEHSVLLLAAPRQGKTSQVIIPWLANWDGPALVTSVRDDVALNTITLRQQRGPVLVMDLSGTRWPWMLRWSPTSDCERFDKARERADIMVAVGRPETGSDSTNAGFFGLTATNLLAAWLHAAALTGRSMADVLRWSLDATDDEPIRLLASHPDAAPGVAELINGIYQSPAETRSNMWTTVQTAVAPLLSTAARDVFCPPPGDGLNVANFLQDGGTIYLRVSEKQAGALAPLISAFVDELTATAQRLAKRNDSGRLSPPLALILDEVANVVPLPHLPALMSYAGGSGIFVVAVLQDMAQARARWGRDGADMIWGAATAKIALGGLTGDELAEFSKLAGEYRETVTSTSRSLQHGTTMQTQLGDRKTLSPDRVRTLDQERRQALVIAGTTPAVITQMVRHYESEQADAYAASVTAIRKQLAELEEHRG
ncbi:type IV secretory system conjugative DNA transfer family protein [Pilimelia columellifera]|uniref:TraD/TraG TraM recognition site domain-containing protein n=1 Tax=Pilimelia columellifera subsp. columellifera TaxID=706583 RepID=A0ABN3NHJ5_9ACTN